MDIDNNSTAAVQLQQQQQQQLSNSSSSGSGSSTAALADAAEAAVADAAEAAVAAVRVQRLTPAAFHMFVACMDTYNRLQGKIRAPVVPSNSGDDNATGDSDTEAAAVAAAGGLRAMAESYASAIAGL
jgi:hypothetical protein